MATDVPGASGSVSIDTSVSACGGTGTAGRGRGLTAGLRDANSWVIFATISSGAKSPTATTAMRSGLYQSL